MVPEGQGFDAALGSGIVLLAAVRCSQLDWRPARNAGGRVRGRGVIRDCPSFSYQRIKPSLPSTNRTGFQLKLSKSVDDDIREASVEWLGFICRWRNNPIEARYKLLCPENQNEHQAACDQLVERFRALHDRSDASLWRP